MGDARIVEGDVDPAVFVLDLLGQLADFRRTRHVGRKKLQPKCLRGFFSSLGIEVGNDNRRAVFL